MPPATTPWTDEKCEELKRLWAEGYSASDIAKQLGIGVTRSGVLGKVMRLQLEKRKSAEFKPGPPRPPRPSKAMLRRAVFISPVARPEPEPPAPSRQKPRMRRLQLMQLQDHHCRWPYGDPYGRPFYFCAADREPGVPYCAFHMTRAFVKPRAR